MFLPNNSIYSYCAHARACVHDIHCNIKYFINIVSGTIVLRAVCTKENEWSLYIECCGSFATHTYLPDLIRRFHFSEAFQKTELFIFGRPLYSLHADRRH